MLTSRSPLQRLTLVLAVAGLLSGCSYAFGREKQFDRCHKDEQERDTLYFEFLCVQNP